jgi:hypothetical protein
MTSEQREKWRAQEHQWNVSWHGTDAEGGHCKQCHATTERGGGRGFGPEMRTVAHGSFTAAEHASQRARYTTPTRLHTAEFAAHAGGRACTECHVSGNVRAEASPKARPFWHALHVADGALAPARGRGNAVSGDANAGCVSCHADLRSAKALRGVDAGGYRWPSDPQAQAACAACHREGEGKPLALTPVPSPIPDERRIAVPDFPHDVHLGSAAYGVAGTALAEGCFACHEFERPAGLAEYAFVPRTKPGAANCTSCHSGHDNVGGGQCRQCHPAEEGRSNSFLAAAAVKAGDVFGSFTVPPLPMRTWPGATGFSHLSRGHSAPDLSCETCHARDGLSAAKAIDAVRIPDEKQPACRDCHLKQQFHWR